MKFYYILLALSSFSLASHSLHAEEAIEMKMRWEEGKTYRLTQSMKGESIVMGKNSVFAMSLNMDCVAAEDEKGTLVSFDFTKVKAKVSAGKKIIIDADSDKPETFDGPTGMMFKGLMAAQAKALYGKDGQFLELTEVKGLDENSPMSPDQFEQTAEFSNWMLPKDSVKVGDTWKVEQVMPMAKFGEAAVTVEATLNKIEIVEEHRVAFITYTGMMDLKMENGTPIGMKSDKYIGELEFDIDFGTTLKLTNSTSIEMTMPGVEEAIVTNIETALILKEVIDTP